MGRVLGQNWLMMFCCKMSGSNTAFPHSWNKEWGLNGLRGNGALQILRGDQLKLKLMGEIKFLFVSQISSPNILSYLPHPDEASYKGGNCRQVRNHLGNQYIAFVEG